jgi:hypothetical protein
VVAGGIDDHGPAVSADLEVVEVGVVVDQDRGDGLSLDLAGRGASGQDLLAWLEG